MYRPHNPGGGNLSLDCKLIEGSEEKYVYLFFILKHCHNPPSFPVVPALNC